MSKTTRIAACPFADTYENLRKDNPILRNGQRVYVTDKKQWYTGDGITAFNDLQPESLGGDLSGYEKTENKLVDTNWSIADMNPDMPSGPEEDEFINSEKYVGVKTAVRWAREAYGIGFEAKDIAEGLSNKLTNNIEPVIDNLSDITNKGLEYIEIKDANAEWYPASINIGTGGGNGDNYICIGFNTEGNGICIGNNAKSLYSAETALEYDTEAGTPLSAIQIGEGTNNHPDTFQVYNYQLLDAEGKIPAERLPEGIGGGSEILQEELERLQYYGDKDIVPTDSKYFIFEGGTDVYIRLKDEYSSYNPDTPLDIVIPYCNDDGVEITHIGNSCLTDTNTRSVIIPKSIISIGSSAFYGTALQYIEIPKNVESIGDQAFYDCTNLTKISISDKVTSIGTDAFYNHHEDLIIICNQGSYAETYAKENGIKYAYNYVDIDNLGGSSADLSGYEKTENKLLTTNWEIADIDPDNPQSPEEDDFFNSGKYTGVKVAARWAKDAYNVGVEAKDIAERLSYKITSEVEPVIANLKDLTNKGHEYIEIKDANAEWYPASINIGTGGGNGDNFTCIGFNTEGNGICIGNNAKSLYSAETALEYDTEAGTPLSAIQIGAGTNNHPLTFQVYNYQLLDAQGKIPEERISNMFYLDGDNLKISIGGKTFTLTPDAE